MLGVLLFVGCVGLALSFDSLIGTFRSVIFRADAGAPIHRAKAAVAQTISKDHSPGSSPALDLQPFIGWREWSLAGLLVVVGIWSQIRVGHAWAPAALSNDAYFELPANIGGWEKVTREASIVERPQMDAAKTFLWQFRRGDLIASVALDYPFPSSHELTICYALSGWTLGDRTVQPGQTQVRMQKPAGMEGLLFFECINERGQWEPPPAPISASGWSALLVEAGRHGQGEPTYQLQTLVQSYSPLSQVQIDATRDLYQQTRDSITAQLLAQLPKVTP
jgi:hypothetical protein